MLYLIRKIKQKFSEKKIDWHSRAKKMGLLSVVNSKHGLESYKKITEIQKKILYPIFESNLNGSEVLGLDFGCGAGRFTPDLANIADCKVTGYDPTIELLKIAPTHPFVEYIADDFHNLKVDLKFDFIWCCLVCGNFDKKELHSNAQQMMSKLNNNGFIMLVEIISRNDCEETHWKQYSLETYEKAFDKIHLVKMGEYLDVNEQVSIFVGRLK